MTTSQRKKRSRRRENLSLSQVVADGVRLLRTRRGITQKALADELGWPQSTIARIELGNRTISVDDLAALAWALDVAPAFLLSGSFQDEDVPVHQTVRARPDHMLSWVRGYEPLPGLDYRRFTENRPESEWVARMSPEDRAAYAAHYEQAEELLASGAVERTPGAYARLPAEKRAELDMEREARKRELEASQRAGKKKESGQ